MRTVEVAPTVSAPGAFLTPVGDPGSWAIGGMRSWRRHGPASWAAGLTATRVELCTKGAAVGLAVMRVVVEATGSQTG
ncbi:MAG: hypothetical protein FD129_10 [bacterium]|nr:MAG: hypothetical protein FD129_10 [bacterium]